VRLILPRPRHIDSLVRLSRKFAAKHGWTATIPIGQIHSPESARPHPSSYIFWPTHLFPPSAERLFQRFRHDGQAETA